MKTIQEFVSGGINSPAELQDSLKTAMRLEFATIPPYLCAQWSIDGDHDPDDVGDMIGDIVIQEMKHFAQAGNLLTAIGGMPEVAKASFIVDYPAHTLPGGIAQELPVDLKPLSQGQLAVFMQIEKPEFAPIPVQPLAEVVKPPATIGDFYDTIEGAFAALKPAIDPNAHAVVSRGVMPIKTLDDVKPAIEMIKSQGEGTTVSPDQAPAGGVLAHYYAFQQIAIGKTLSFVNGKLVPGNPLIAFPGVLDFQPSSAAPDPSLAFSQLLTKLLINLQGCWSKGDPVDTDDMDALQAAGTALIQRHIQPRFAWAP